MYSYAGTPLAEPNGTQVADWLIANIRPQELFPLAYQSWPAALGNGPVLNQSPEVPRSVQISSLFWPHGASRFARAHFVVTKPQLDLIRKVVFKNGAQIAAPLVLSDGQAGIITNMWMLPCLPLATGNLPLSMWLLTLVDDRYFWWGKSVDLTVEDDTEWGDLYDAIAVELEEAIVYDPVAAAYGDPTIDYNCSARPLPPILDAIAFSVGQRLTRALDGTLRAQSYLTSKAVLVANQTAGWTPYAGGAYAL